MLTMSDEFDEEWFRNLFGISEEAAERLVNLPDSPASKAQGVASDERLAELDGLIKGENE